MSLFWLLLHVGVQLEEMTRSQLMSSNSQPQRRLNVREDIPDAGLRDTGGTKEDCDSEGAEGVTTKYWEEPEKQMGATAAETAAAALELTAVATLRMAGTAAASKTARTATEAPPELLAVTAAVKRATSQYAGP
ncbi:hypothetical protein JB92DRAFT_3113077 [Gautieria morchelliformis]|nr:hypothetical protein JB92DRAFT_3113077 [Gautieria morchelliformis]